MAVLKVIEVLSNSEKSWEDATKKAVAHAAKSLKNIRSVYVQDQSASVTNGDVKPLIKLCSSLNLTRK